MVTGNDLDTLSRLSLASEGIAGASLQSFPLRMVPPWGVLFIAVSLLVLVLSLLVLGLVRWRAARAQREFAGTGEDLSELEDLASVVWYRHTQAAWDSPPAGDYAAEAATVGFERRDA